MADARAFQDTQCLANVPASGSLSKVVLGSQGGYFLGYSDVDQLIHRHALGLGEVYRDVLATIARLDCVAMANFISRGSQDANALTNRLGEANRSLLERVFEFADDLNAEIVQALAPRLIVVPFSLGRNRRFDAVRPLGLSLSTLRDANDASCPF